MVDRLFDGWQAFGVEDLFDRLEQLSLERKALDEQISALWEQRVQMEARIRETAALLVSTPTAPEKTRSSCKHSTGHCCCALQSNRFTQFSARLHGEMQTGQDIFAVDGAQVTGLAV